MKPLRVKTLTALTLTVAALSVTSGSSAESVTTLTTKGDQSVLLQKDTHDIIFTKNVIDNTYVIEVDPSVSYQTVDGMGYTLTEASAAEILKLSEAEQNALLNEIYHPVTGNRTSMVRIAIGASDLSTELYTFSEQTRSGDNFVPNPDKTYYIDMPAHDVRLGATGFSEDPYTEGNSPSGEDFEWKFVPAGDGLYFIDRAAGGDTPRLRTDDTNMADMQETTSDGWWEKWELTPGETHGSYFLSLPLKGFGNHDRLQIDGDHLVRIVDNDQSAGTWESFTFTEVGSDKSFSLAGPEMDHRIPVLKKIIAINPDIKILATPWTAPLWMKTNNDWVGGSLKPEHYGDLAQYFVDYIAAMKAEGINIWAITPQNEPENPWNEPSMLMSAEEQLALIDGFVGPALDAAGFGDVKILSFDHNLDSIEYPIHVAQSEYVDGSAFHLYAGDIADMTTVYNATGKDVYFTEQFTGTPKEDTPEAWAAAFDMDFWVHNQWVVMGSLRNYSRSVMQWNLITSDPTTPTGCVVCLGAYSIENGNIQRNVGVYNIAQLASMLEPGAKRIASTPFAEEATVINVALQNPDGSVVVLVYNKSAVETHAVTIALAGKSFEYDITPRTAVTFRWLPGADTPDSDNDGVVDTDDLCPATVTGEPVDAFGCSLLDDDNDGVNNQADNCPNTEAGVEVNERGCKKTQPAELSCASKVSNDWGTGGQIEISITNNSTLAIDGWQAQVLLASGLHIINSWNSTVISETPAVFGPTEWNKQIAANQSVGFGFQVEGANVQAPDCIASLSGNPVLDDDNDGVPNEQDLCPTTTPGASVDSNGCEQCSLDCNPDLDGDGVLNEVDLCPNTPTGVKVDSNGCAVDNGSCSGVTIYPNWLHADYDGGPNTHLLAGDQMVFDGQLFEANWYTNSEPGSDNSWTHIGACQ